MRFRSFRRVGLLGWACTLTPTSERRLRSDYHAASEQADTQTDAGIAAQHPEPWFDHFGILKQHPAVLERPEPLVLVDELGAATVNLRVTYWFESRTHSPAKANSALLRLTKSALLEAGIELPDPAREVVFPKGVPRVRVGEAYNPVQPVHDLNAIGPAETQDATAGEGDLTSDTGEIANQSQGQVLEASENLLKR